MQDADSGLKGTGPGQGCSGDVKPKATNTGRLIPQPEPAQEKVARLEIDGVLNPAQAEVIMDMQERQNGGDTSDKNAQALGDLPLTPVEKPQAAAIAPSAHVAKDQSVRSYLAWLHHRQTRFPIAVPNRSECVMIAKKLGRPPGYVYDEILYRWGFETDSRWGKWYKQNRLLVLGKDPKFGEEIVGKWEAWLQEGRDLKARQP
jgi:hypothetical protein